MSTSSLAGSTSLACSSLPSSPTGLGFGGKLGLGLGADLEQGCQIFRDTIYQQWEKHIPNDRNTFQMSVKYSKWS
jgi:hypothetical protein